MTGNDTAGPAPTGASRSTALSDLVLAAQKAGLSYGQMAEASKGAGRPEGMSKAWFQRLATNAVATAPGPDELAAVARALRKPLRIIQQAAASQWLAWEPIELSGYDDDMRHIIIVAAGMDPRERRRVRAMLDAATQIDHEDLTTS